MSLENFFLRYPADSSLRERIAKERLLNRSSVATFALSLARKAGSGLRELTRNLGTDVAFGLDSESFIRLPQDIRRKLRVNHAGVIFGVSIPPIEGSCVTGIFDLEEWCTYYNMAMRGTPFSQMKAEEGKSKEILSEDHLQGLRGVVRKNPTFASLFAEDVRFAPNSLGSILVDSQILPIIQQDILPFYTPNARLLVA